ncbi:MAG: hypothetical protein H8K05_04370 [Nitrospira sp.]|nr:hypothetical protein [Nitrospira sp.]
MRLQTTYSNLLRLDRMLRAWAVAWLLAFPLFHIHPETDPHHGAAGHIHAASVHTVFSADLEGEFGDHRNAYHHAPEAESGPALSTEGPHAWNADPELSFSLLNDATERKLVKPLLAHPLFVTHNLLPVPKHPDRTAEQHAVPLASIALACNLPARAPPSTLLS